jgi:AcrR family transcriptional regulator
MSNEFRSGSRRPPEHRRGRRPGSSAETQPAILAVARDSFAQRGYGGTTIRAVADAAGVDPALVHHYFGTKEGLFRAALDMPIDPEALVEQIMSAGPHDAPLRLVRTFLQVWESPDTGPAMISFLRRALSEQGHLDLVRDFIGTALLRTAAARLLTGVDPEQARIRIGLVMSQMLGLVIMRMVLAVEPVAGMTADDLAAAVAPTIERYLSGDLSAPVRARRAGGNAARRPHRTGT